MLNFVYNLLIKQFTLLQIPAIKFLRCPYHIFNHQNLVKFGRDPKRVHHAMPDYIKTLLQRFSGNPKGSIDNYFFLQANKIIFPEMCFPFIQNWQLDTSITHIS